MSGGGALFGGNQLKGAELAIAEINAAGGITVNNKNYVFKLTAMDDGLKPANAVSNVRRMLTTLNPKPVFVICTGSPITPGTPLARVHKFLELGRQYGA